MRKFENMPYQDLYDKGFGIIDYLTDIDEDLCFGDFQGIRLERKDGIIMSFQYDDVSISEAAMELSADEFCKLSYFDQRVFIKNNYSCSAVKITKR